MVTKRFIMLFLAKGKLLRLILSTKCEIWATDQTGKPEHAFIKFDFSADTMASVAFW